MKILMVCMGNICRSPLAEGILRSKLPSEFRVDSAGTIAFHEGKKADERAIKVAAKNGISIEDHRARLVTKKDLQEFDQILCMDLDNFETTISMAMDESQRSKIQLLLEEAGQHGEQIEVPDPYYGDAQDFEDVFHLLEDACTKISLKYLQKI